MLVMGEHRLRGLMSMQKMLHHLGSLALLGLNIEIGGEGGVAKIDVMLDWGVLHYRGSWVVQHFFDQPLGEDQTDMYSEQKQQCANHTHTYTSYACVYTCSSAQATQIHIHVAKIYVMLDEQCCSHCC